MSDDLHNIDDLFRKGLSDHAEAPPQSAWDHIDKSLDKKKVIAISKKYYQLKWIAVVLLVLSVGMAMLTLYVGKRNQELVKENREHNDARQQKTRAAIPAADSIEVAGHSSVHADQPSMQGLHQGQVQDTTAMPMRVNNGPSVAYNHTKEISTVPKVSLSSGNQASAAKDDGRPPALPTDQLMRQKGPEKNGNKMAGLRPASHLQIAAAGTVVSIGASKSTENLPPDRSTNILNGSREKNSNSKRSLSGYHPETTPDGTNSQNPPEAGRQDLAATVKATKAGRLTAPYPDFVRETKNGNFRFPPPFTGTAEVEPVADIRPAISIRLLLNRKGNAQKHGPKMPAFKPSKWSATVFFSPDWITKKLKDNDVRFREEERREIQKDERNQFSSTFGVMVNLAIAPKITLQSGLSLSSWATNIEAKTIYARPDGNGNPNYRINCAAGYSYINVKSSPAPAYGDSIHALRSNNRLTYLEVPLEVKYRLGNNRWEVLPGMGFSANFLTQGKIATTVATNSGDVKATSDKIDGLRPLYLSGLANVTFQYRISKAVAIALTPASRFGLSAINKNAPVKTDLYAFGLEAGINIKL